MPLIRVHRDNAEYQVVRTTNGKGSCEAISCRSPEGTLGRIGVVEAVRRIVQNGFHQEAGWSISDSSGEWGLLGKA
jgi:hypothetical protein